MRNERGQLVADPVGVVEDSGVVDEVLSPEVLMPPALAALMSGEVLMPPVPDGGVMSVLVEQQALLVAAEEREARLARRRERDAARRAARRAGGV